MTPSSRERPGESNGVSSAEKRRQVNQPTAARSSSAMSRVFIWSITANARWSPARNVANCATVVGEEEPRLDAHALRGLSGLERLPDGRGSSRRATGRWAAAPSPGGSACSPETSGRWLRPRLRGCLQGERVCLRGRKTLKARLRVPGQRRLSRRACGFHLLSSPVPGATCACRGPAAAMLPGARADCRTSARAARPCVAGP